MALIEIDGLPNLKMGGSFHFANCECHNQMVYGDGSKLHRGALFFFHIKIAGIGHHGHPST